MTSPPQELPSTPAWINPALINPALIDPLKAAVFTVPNFRLECGVTLPEAILRWQWRGPSPPGAIAAGEPILACTAFGATALDLAYLAEPGGPLDASQRPVLHVEMLGNGRSSSPSNTAVPWQGPNFPSLTIRDNVALQLALLDHLGIQRLHAVVGASLGGAQALQWAVSHPERVGRAAVIAGNARTTFYGRLFLHTVSSALRSDPAFEAGHYRAPPLVGLTRLSETWAAFALSPRFFSTGRHRHHADMAADDVAGFLAKWGARYHTRDANDLLSQLATWDAHDVGISATTEVPLLFLPISTDTYFHPEDVREQAAAFPRAQVQVIDSLSGHAAAFGREATDRASIAKAVSAFLG